MVLVGNGFDIAVLNKFGDKKMNGKSTKYSDFFEYVTYFRLCDDNNLIYKKMKEDHEQDKENWCDFESSVDELLGEMIIFTLKGAVILKRFIHTMNCLHPFLCGKHLDFHSWRLLETD